ncbi:unnamed protein product [Linum trigynum]|uniref:Dof zinc finger protein n=1 Tax=Linum trigynum TaxID=586398 RepID=A0AAV2DVR2_9ROSI
MASDHGSNKPPPGAATTTSSPSPARQATSDQQQQQQQQLGVVIKCPRCDSPNTKFCYYNNYSLSQPRHFCKTCRRYWTKGGALRNVPIGGASRKSKKQQQLKPSSSSSSSAAATTSSSEIGGFKFFHHPAGGLNSPPPPPQMDFNLKDLSLMPNYNLHNQFSFDAAVSAPTPSPPLGFSLEPPTMTMMMMRGGGAGGSMNVNTSLASSIESLSCMNQDLHWKLQQQRLSTLFGDNNNVKDGGNGGAIGLPRQHEDDQREPEKPQPILFRDLGEIRMDGGKPEVVVVGGGGGKGEGEAATEWFFGNSYGQVVGSGSAAAAAASNNGGASWNGGGNGGGLQASWGDLNPYGTTTTSLP